MKRLVLFLVLFCCWLLLSFYFPGPATVAIWIWFGLCGIAYVWRRRRKAA